MIQSGNSINFRTKFNSFRENCTFGSFVISAAAADWEEAVRVGIVELARYFQVKFRVGILANLDVRFRS